MYFNLRVSRKEKNNMPNKEKFCKAKVKKTLVAGVLAGAMASNVLAPAAIVATEGQNTPYLPRTSSVYAVDDYGVDSLSSLDPFDVVILGFNEEGGGPGPGPGTGGGGSGGTLQPQQPEPPAVEPMLTILSLPVENTHVTAVSQATADAAMIAVATLAATVSIATGKTIALAGEPISISVGSANSVMNISAPDEVHIESMTTMAILHEDGTITPVPTRIDEDGNIIIFVTLRGDVTLVPLAVTANFADIGAQTQNVQEEINRAASLKIIQGVGDGVFNPTAAVTNQEATTMFLRAIGTPVEFETALNTANNAGLIGAGIVAGEPMTRIEAAKLAANVLELVGKEWEITVAQAEAAIADFDDLDGLSDEEKIALAVTVHFDIFQGAGGGLMNPNATIQRSQMASVAVRLQDVILNTFGTEKQTN
jgi:hypothetical protein